jgi:CRISPR system Cascade subunit CasA
VSEFDLISEPWLPVIKQGRRIEVSLERALTEANMLDGLATSDVLEGVAVFREVLLPVAIDALGLPVDEEEWAHRWRQ